MIARFARQLRGALANLFKVKFVRDTLTLQAGNLIITAINIVTSIILVRGLGSRGYGVYSLMLTMYGLLLTLNLTGLGPSSLTQLAETIAARNRDETRNLAAFFVQMSLIVAVAAGVIAFLFGPWFAERSYGDASIGQLMRFYTLTLFLNPLYTLVLIVFQSARSMRAYAILANTGLLLDAGLTVLAIVLRTGVEGIVIVRLLGAGIKAAGGLWAYRWLRSQHPDVMPSVSSVLRIVPHASLRPYWRFGFQLALDKNVVLLYTLLPQQLLGMWASPEAAGYLRMALSALERPALFFSGILDNVAVRLPADVGQRDYIRLTRNFKRLLRWNLVLSVGVLGTFALVAPLIVPLLYGKEYKPAVPVVVVLCVYGLITAVGGIFGPLYRSLRLMRPILAVKALALVLAGLPMIGLVREFGAVGGAWSINLFFFVSVALTMAVTWPPLTRLARDQAALHELE